MKNRITVGISLPDNLHVMVDHAGSFSRLLKVNSKDNFLEYIGILNELYDAHDMEEEYKKRIIGIDDVRAIKKFVKLVIFLTSLGIGIVIYLALSGISNLFTISNFFKLLALILGDITFSNIIGDVYYGTNKKINKREEFLEKKLLEIEKEKEKLRILCKEKEKEFEISEIGLDISYRIDNCINKKEKYNERWYNDTYKEKDIKIDVYRGLFKEDYYNINKNKEDNVDLEELEDKPKIIGIKSLRR